jgi:hypothetical protein
MKQAMERVKGVSEGLPVIIEAKTAEEALDAVELKPTRVLLDNFTPGAIASTVKRLRGSSVEIEISGGIRWPTCATSRSRREVHLDRRAHALRAGAGSLARDGAGGDRRSRRRIDRLADRAKGELRIVTSTFLDVPLERHPSLPSTNDEALRRAEEGAPSGLIVFAETQTAGRAARGALGATSPAPRSRSPRS